MARRPLPRKSVMSYTREELLNCKPDQHFEMKGDLLIVRTITEDFDGYPIRKDLMYVCRWYAKLKVWLIDPKEHQMRAKKLTRIVGIKKKS
jgi:hypothetical protein